MDFLELVVLALVQGVTEFLPISSSGHLILVSQLTGWQDQGLLIDVSLHIGTLVAVVLYFWRDVLEVLAGALDIVRGRVGTPAARLLLQIALATLPVVVVGFLAKDLVETGLRSALIIATTTIVFGVLLWIADRNPREDRTIADLGYGDALVIGLLQAVALIPGTSRSGITMTGGRFLGMERAESARFSMLLSIPTIVAAGALATLDLVQSGDVTLQADAVIAAALAFVSALVAIWAMLAWLKRATFTVFVVYRLVLGAFLFAWLYS